MGEYDRTGAGISPLSGKGTPNRILPATSGTAVAPFSAKGVETFQDHPLVGITRQWQRSLVSSAGVWTDIQNAKDLTYVVTTADRGCYLRVVEYNWNYLGSASVSSDPTEAFYVADSGASVTSFTGKGLRNIEADDTGKAVTDFDGTGPGGDTRAKTGMAVASFTGKGADAFTDSDTGKGVAERTGHGGDVFVESDSGTGISAFSGGGVEA